jgi:UBA-like domain/UBA/TS-N domain/STI1/HOP, DP domain
LPSLLLSLLRAPAPFCPFAFCCFARNHMSFTVRAAMTGATCQLALPEKKGTPLIRYVLSHADGARVVLGDAAPASSSSSSSSSPADIPCILALDGRLVTDDTEVTPGDVVVALPPQGQRRRRPLRQVPATGVEPKSDDGEQKAGEQPAGPAVAAIVEHMGRHYGIPQEQWPSPDTLQTAGNRRRRQAHGGVNAANPFAQHIQQLVNTLSGVNPGAPQPPQMQPPPQPGQEQQQQQQPAEPEDTMTDEELAQWEPPVDEDALGQLTSMGFPEARARKALALFRGNVEQAMEWILEHEDDPDLDEPIPLAVKRRLRQVMRVDEAERDAFQPDDALREQLVQMGFPENEVVDALRHTGNNLEAASAWLIGDRDSARAAMEEAEGTPAAAPGAGPGMAAAEAMMNAPGGSFEGRLIQALISNPTIQQGLSNPRVLQAVQAIMQDPGSALQYVGDPEIGPVLLQFQQVVGQGMADEDDDEDEDDEDEDDDDDDDMPPLPEVD